MAGTALPAKLSAPAIRALEGAGITSLEDVAKRSAAEIKALHGIGKFAILQIDKALHDAGLRFRD
jgi:hypothetical protein